MNILFRVFVLFIGITITGLSHADIKQERKDFIAAEKALKKGDSKTWKKLEPRLRNYPLHADLIFKRAIQALGKTSEKDATHTLGQLENTPLRKTYLRSWLNRLAGKKQWAAYIKFYEEKLGTRASCQYAHALYQTSNSAKALPLTKKLWLVGKSQHKDCDPAFRFFKNSGQLTRELVWERIELAINKGKAPLARYLAKMLPASERSLVEEWLRIRSKPERALVSKYLASDNTYRKKMLYYGIRRMALFEADKALQEWNKIKHKTRLDENQIEMLESWIARRLTTQKLAGATQQYQHIAYPQHEDLEWASRAALQENNWGALKQSVEQMGKVSELNDRWKYWLARAAEQTGDNTTANTLYHLLASDRGYHNFLAADRLSLPYQFNEQPLRYTREELAPLLNDYNVRRAQEFFQFNRLPEARREWYYLIRQRGDEDRQKLSFIAKQWGWDSQAILTIARADHDDDLSIRFPVLFRDQVIKASQKKRLDSSWVMALVRQESAFQPDARSSAGARGLMQLMPGTGRQVARLLKRRRPKTYELYQPELNILLGTQYLKTNLDKHGGNKVLATAAYNAGPHRVTKWLPDTMLDADAWTEAIPFKETRGYVQRIMSYAAIYDQKLGQQPTRLNIRMKPVTP